MKKKVFLYINMFVMVLFLLSCKAIAPECMTSVNSSTSITSIQSLQTPTIACLSEAPFIEADRIRAEKEEKIRLEREAAEARLAEEARIAEEARLANEELAKKARKLRNRMTGEELLLLQKVVEAEVTGEDEELYIEKLAVCNSILNRVYSKAFPNTIKDVLFQDLQYQPVMNGYIYEVEPGELTKRVVNDALSGESVLPAYVTYFCAKSLDDSAKEWFDKNLCEYDIVELHMFYYDPNNM